MSTARLPGFLLAQLVGDPGHLGDLPADGLDRIEGRERVLEDHGDLSTADLAHAGLLRVQQVLAPPRHHVGLVLAGGTSSRPMTLSDVTDLPDPDSPTMESTSRRTSKLILSTALTTPASVANVVRRLRTDSNTSGSRAVGANEASLPETAGAHLLEHLPDHQRRISGRGCRAVRRRRGRTKAP